jgi:hypothetical protein
VGPLEAATPSVDPSLVRRWRDGESRFFASSMADPDLYLAALGLVRGLAAGLRDLASEEELEAAYAERGLEWADRQLAEIDVPDAEMLDIATAREAAFNLRLRELQSEVAVRTTAEQLEAARATGASWLVTADGDVGFGGQRVYRRVDLHTRLGVALYGYSSRDPGRGQTFWFEVLAIDPETGSRIRGAAPLFGARSRRDREALHRTFAAARRLYDRRA